MENVTRKPTPAFDLGKYVLSIESKDLSAKVFWARIVSSEHESLLTDYTKHTFFEVQYALEGRIVITVGEQRFHLDESDFIVIPPDTYHQIVDGDSTGARFIMAFSLLSTEELAAGLAISGASPHRESPVLRAILELILQKGAVDSPLCAKTLSSLAEAFLLELCDIVTPAATLPDAKELNLTENQQRIATIRAFIHDYHGIGLSVGDIARRFGIGERHLTRLFRAELGHSPREEINHEKLRHIEELIASTALSFSEISALCGFCDEYAMNKFFKRYNKMRLSDYRRTVGKKDRQMSQKSPYVV
ncbi:MAG: helix-turn-helix domain-containing protein [Clostridia bacterium]|nr:helix-turn-helix domain-containing protein [Clostridia bacterium]